MKWSLRFESGFILILALGVLLIPIPWLIAWLLAALWHEMCHLAALKILRCNVYSVSIGGYGAKIEADIPHRGKMVLCALAGPIGGIALALLYRLMPRVALCALFQSAYNLLPIFPLDGGRALAGVVGMLFKTKCANIIVIGVEIIVKIVLIVLSIFSIIYWRLGMLPLLLAVNVLLQNKNIPCKEGCLRVQYP